MQPSNLVDPFGRIVDYLRISVTDRCNFRCVYCMPEEGFPCLPKEEVLRADEMVRLVRIAAELGVRKVRITGGEPLLRNDIVEIVRSISQISGIDDLSLTTNGALLAEKAPDLAEAGLARINVSLDTLRPERFQSLARRGDLETVLAGIWAAQEVGLTPVKINAVAMRTLNADEAADFADWTKLTPIHVRWIELMPMRWSLDDVPSTPMPANGLLSLRQAPGGMLSDLEMRREFIGWQQLKTTIETVHGPLEPAKLLTNGPAQTYRIPGGVGTIGFISQITNDFCSSCNRIRLTHDGFLRPCLMADGELDLRTSLRQGASDEVLKELFRRVVSEKPERHFLADGQKVVGRGMSQIGG